MVARDRPSDRRGDPVAGQQAVALLVFTLVGSIGVGAPVLVTTVMGERAEALLTSVDRWTTRRSTLIVAAVLLVPGIVLTFNGLATL